MEVQFTPDQEEQLFQIAMHAGTDAAHVVKNAALRVLEQDAKFRDGVNRGIAAADQGDFVEPEAVWANVEQMLQR